jgi:hypothetical protein
MTTLTASTKERLHQLAQEVHEAELRAELQSLADRFSAWERGDLTCGELNDCIHAYHRGPARDLHGRLSSLPDDIRIAHAVAQGYLVREQVPEEILESLDHAINYFETMDS